MILGGLFAGQNQAIFQAILVNFKVLTKLYFFLQRFSFANLFLPTCSHLTKPHPAPHLPLRKAPQAPLRGLAASTGGFGALLRAK